MTPDSRGDSPSRAGTLALVGGVLALDFCNTSSGRATGGHQEHLRTAEHLLAWAHHAQILDDAGAARLRHLCERDGDFARQLLGRALAMREALHKLANALASRHTVEQADVDEVATIYAACLAKGRLGSRDRSFGWTWPVEHAPAETVLGPIAASAMALITEADRARLKRCEGHHCGWLFLDATKSNNRRWCEMEPCGNRAKQKRRRTRLRSGD